MRGGGGGGNYGVVVVVVAPAIRIVTIMLNGRRGRHFGNKYGVVEVV